MNAARRYLNTNFNGNNGKHFTRSKISKLNNKIQPKKYIQPCIINCLKSSKCNKHEINNNSLKIIPNEKVNKLNDNYNNTKECLITVVCLSLYIGLVVTTIEFF